jgi:hypothetical protein
MSEMTNLEQQQPERELPHFNYNTRASQYRETSPKEVNLLRNRTFQCTILCFCIIALCLLAIAIVLPLFVFNNNNKNNNNYNYYYGGNNQSTPINQQTTLPPTTTKTVKNDR